MSPSHALERRRPLRSFYELLDLPRVPDRRGSLTFLEGGRHVPFDIARVYYLYDVPASATRAGHAHYRLIQLLIAAAGSFDVNLDNGSEKASIHLDRPYRGLLLRPMVWRTIDGFSGGAMCLVLASTAYDEADYIRDYSTFLRLSLDAE
jgi:WxcM-like protein